MLRSVNRFAVEINHPESEYFERILCFVRPQYAENGTIDLHRAAQECISELDEQLGHLACTQEDKARSPLSILDRIRALPDWVLMSASGFLGMLLAATGFLLIF